MIAARNMCTKQMCKAANEERLMVWGAGNRLSLIHLGKSLCFARSIELVVDDRLSSWCYLFGVPKPVSCSEKHTVCWEG